MLRALEEHRASLPRRLTPAGFTEWLCVLAEVLQIDWKDLRHTWGVRHVEVSVPPRIHYLPFIEEIHDAVTDAASRIEWPAAHTLTTAAFSCEVLRLRGSGG